MAYKTSFPKGRTWLSIVVFSIMTIVSLFLSVSELVDCLGSIRRLDVVVAFWPRVMGGMPIALMFATVVAMLLLSLRLTPDSVWFNRAFGFILICLVTVPFTPWLVSLTVDARLVDQGYVRCPTINERPTKTRWAKSLGLCPLHGS